MTAEERELCLALVVQPGRGAGRLEKDEFVRQFPRAIEQGMLAVTLLDEAYRSRNSDELRCALIVGFVFGFRDEHALLLCRALEEDWHLSHEDVVSALDRLRTPAAVDALFSATQWIPEYLDYDDNRAFARKAIWALGKLGTAEADQKLQLLARSEDENLRDAAQEQLLRRGSPVG